MPPTDTPLGDEPYTADFEEFWNAYPKNHRGGKWDAFRKWEQLNCTERKGELIADVAKRAAEDRSWIAGFIPHASRYLNGRLWHAPINRAQALARAGPQSRIETELGNTRTAQEWAEREED